MLKLYLRWVLQWLKRYQGIYPVPKRAVDADYVARVVERYWRMLIHQELKRMEERLHG